MPSVPFTKRLVLMEYGMIKHTDSSVSAVMHSCTKPMLKSHDLTTSIKVTHPFGTFKIERGFYAPNICHTRTRKFGLDSHPVISSDTGIKSEGGRPEKIGRTCELQK